MTILVSKDTTAQCGYPQGSIPALSQGGYIMRGCALPIPYLGEEVEAPGEVTVAHSGTGAEPQPTIGVLIDGPHVT